MCIVPNLANCAAPIKSICLPVLTRLVPEPVVQQVLDECGAQAKRERKLSMSVIVWLIIAVHFYVQEPISYVFEKICSHLLSDQSAPPGASALVYRRYQLGVRPLVALFGRICKPLAQLSTPGAFLFGLRLMSIDAQKLTMPDTEPNDRYFGRMTNDRAQSAYPQALAVYLSECGTHAIIDGGLWPCHTSERIGAARMLRSVDSSMLVLWDRGIYSFEQFDRAVRTGAHVLCRLPANVQVHPDRILEDGSQLVRLYPGQSKHRGSHWREARVIEYIIDDANLPGHGQTHRIATTLTDPALYSAKDLVCAYHERWEIECVADEIETHQCAHADPVLRSHKPLGVIQEFYGLLIAHYVIRTFMQQTADRYRLDPDRISFVTAQRVLCDFTLAFAVTPANLWPELHDAILTTLWRRRLPPRRHRTYPRVVKRKMSNFPLKRDEHRRPPKPAKETFREAICLI